MKIEEDREGFDKSDDLLQRSDFVELTRNEINLIKGTRSVWRHMQTRRRRMKRRESHGCRYSIHFLVDEQHRERETQSHACVRQKKSTSIMSADPIE